MVLPRFKNLIFEIFPSLKAKEIQTLLDNVASLSLLQIVNYILPLITLPYLLRVLAPEKYGLFAFSLVFIQYVLVFTNYGFNLAGTRDIAIYKDNKPKINEIVNSIFLIKGILTITSFIFLSIIVLTVEMFNRDALFFFLSFGIVIGDLFFPVWLFQGLEKMRYISILNCISKIVFTVLIFVLVKNPSDYIIVPLINSLGYLVIGMLSLIIIIRKFAIYPEVPSLKAIKHQLHEGWYIFISTISVSGYRLLPTIILASLFSYEIVAYYSVGDQIIRAALNMINPFTQSLFPLMSRKFHESIDQGLSFVSSILRRITCLPLGFSIVIFILSDIVVNIIAGSEYAESITVLRIFSFLPLIVFVANIFGNQIMLNVNLKSSFSRILVAGGIISVLVQGLLIPTMSITGAAISVFLTEFAVMLMMVQSVKCNLDERQWRILRWYTS